MAVQILINQLGHHIIAKTRMVERVEPVVVTDEEGATRTEEKNTGEVIAYWVENPRLISYSRPEDGSEGVRIKLLDPCPASDETAYGISAHHIVSILEAKADIAEYYMEAIAPLEATEDPSPVLQFEAAPEEGVDEETVEFTVEG